MTGFELFNKLKSGEYSLKGISDVKNSIHQIKINNDNYYVYQHIESTINQGNDRLKLKAFDADLNMVIVEQKPSVVRVSKVGSIADLVVEQPERDWREYVDGGSYDKTITGYVDNRYYSYNAVDTVEGEKVE